jgi:hypothetical protein
VLGVAALALALAVWLLLRGKSLSEPGVTATPAAAASAELHPPAITLVPEVAPPPSAEPANPSPAVPSVRARKRSAPAQGPESFHPTGI